MSARPIPVPPMPLRNPQVNFPSPTPASSVWDRISAWASENKAVVYTVAGVAIVVTGAGVAYYLTDTVSCILCSASKSVHDINNRNLENIRDWTRRIEKDKQEEKEEGGRKESTRS
jgi:import receptor subunit TOM70